MDIAKLKEAERKLEDNRNLWLKSPNKEIKKMAKSQYDKLFPQVQQMRMDLWKETIKIKV